MTSKSGSKLTGAYAAVGAATIAFQKLQVLRHEVQRGVARREAEGITIYDPASLDGRLDRAEAHLDAYADAISDRLPSLANAVFDQMWETTKDTGAQVRSLIGRPPGRSA